MPLRSRSARGRGDPHKGRHGRFHRVAPGPGPRRRARAPGPRARGRALPRTYLLAIGNVISFGPGFGPQGLDRPAARPGARVRGGDRVRCVMLSPDSQSCSRRTASGSPVPGPAARARGPGPGPGARGPSPGPGGQGTGISTRKGMGCPGRPFQHAGMVSLEDGLLRDPVAEMVPSRCRTPGISPAAPSP